MRGSGSGSLRSSAAAAIRPSAGARAGASVSTTAPRAMLIRIAVLTGERSRDVPFVSQPGQGTIASVGAQTASDALAPHAPSSGSSSISRRSGPMVRPMGVMTNTVVPSTEPPEASAPPPAARTDRNNPSGRRPIPPAVPPARARPARRHTLHPLPETRHPQPPAGAGSGDGRRARRAGRIGSAGPGRGARGTGPAGRRRPGVRSDPDRGATGVRRPADLGRRHGLTPTGAIPCSRGRRTFRPYGDPFVRVGTARKTSPTDLR